MPTSITRQLALLAIAAFSVTTAHAPPDAALDVYARPGTMVRIGDHRRLDLRCSGSGAPTVLLEAGALADSMSWSRLQPLVARSTRVCAYDRAGLGFSDEGPAPRDLAADVDDLHALVRAAHLATPLVLVGHSRGSNIVRRYAERCPGDVAGLVLVDPPPQDIAAFSPEWAKADDEQRTAGLAFYEACGKGAERGLLEAPPEELKACLRGPDPRYSAALNTALHRIKSRPAFWRTVIAVTVSNQALFSQPVPADERHGDLPLVVLTADAAYADAQPADRAVLERAQEATHARIAATSTRSRRVHVPGASHDIQQDHPEAVAAAIEDVVAQSRHPLAPARSH